MAQSINSVVIAGNIGRDPEVRTSNNGRQIANLSVATSQRWTDKTTGEQKERTEWHRVVAFGPLAGSIGTRLAKGHQITVVGELQTRKWQDNSGQDRYTTEIVARDIVFPQGTGHQPTQPQPAAAKPADDGFQDDIPF